MAAGEGVRAFGDCNVEMKANLGRFPILDIDGKGKIGQSLAIWYYVATELGFMGANTFEAAQIISVAETIKETNDSFRKLIPC